MGNVRCRSACSRTPGRRPPRRCAKRDRGKLAEAVFVFGGKPPHVPEARFHGLAKDGRAPVGRPLERCPHVGQAQKLEITRRTHAIRFPKSVAKRPFADCYRGAKRADGDRSVDVFEHVGSREHGNFRALRERATSTRDLWKKFRCVRLWCFRHPVNPADAQYYSWVIACKSDFGPTSKNHRSDIV